MVWVWWVSRWDFWLFIKIKFSKLGSTYKSSKKLILKTAQASKKTKFINNFIVVEVTWITKLRD